MTVVDKLAALRRRGIVIIPSADGALRYRPRGALSGAERADLARHRTEIVARLRADPVTWRADVMRSQVAPVGAVPLLLARPGAELPIGSCCSCGDSLGPDERYRCGHCVAASVAVLGSTG